MTTVSGREVPSSRRATRRRPKRGVFRSIVEMQAAINRHLAEHNEIVHHAKPHKKAVIRRASRDGDSAFPRQSDRIPP
jgi:hypothetical protein